MWEDFYLNIELVEDCAKMPVRANVGHDAGCDVFTPTSVIIPASGDLLISLGWRCEFPAGYVMIMKEKSGVATKKKLHIGASVIDNEYAGIVHVHLFNNSNSDVNFDAGDKIAQFVIVPVWSGIPKQVDAINLNTKRGSGGFGSTGK